MTKKQQWFIKVLAKFLVENQAGKSVALELERMRPNTVVTWAKEWAELRGTTPLMGYPTVQQAETELAEFLQLAAPTVTYSRRRKVKHLPEDPFHETHGLA